MGWSSAGFADDGKIKTLVFTGGHDFDPEFYALFEGHPDIEVTQLVQPKANQVFANGTAKNYDVIVLYDMWQGINEAEKKGLLQYLKSGKGFVSLHHSLADYQAWPEYLDIVGGTYILDAKGRDIKGKHYPQSTYKHDIWMDVKIADSDHPLMQGMSDFRISDEGYGRLYVHPESHVLLTVDHPESNKDIAWTKKYKNNEIVAIQLGHGKASYENPNYRRLVAQAIRYAAKRPLAVSLFDGKSLDGWKQVGKSRWSVKNGIMTGIQGANREPGDLLTNESYKDFILTVEYKMDWPGNSGVWFRYQKPDLSYQADILEYKDPLCWSGSLYCPGKMFIAMNKNEKLVNREGWNTFVIRCKGDHLMIDLNGTGVADVRESLSRFGKIGFQIHAGDEFKDMAIHVRKVELVPLGE